jgi:hypothetical protein
MAWPPLFPAKMRFQRAWEASDLRRGQDLLRGSLFCIIVQFLFTLLNYIFHPPRGTHAFTVTTRLLLARKRLPAGKLEVMLMQSGDLWHCTNPARRAELSVGSSRQIEVDHVYCTCGAVMKKQYIPPAFTYLDFLGDRKDRTFVSPSVGVLIDHIRKD